MKLLLANEVTDNNPRSNDNNSQSPITAALYFDLTDPEGERRLREMLDAFKWKCAVWEFERWLRASMDDQRHSDEWMEALGHALQKLFEFFEGEGVNLLDD
jgi:hypothetical protein